MRILDVAQGVVKKVVDRVMTGTTMKGADKDAQDELDRRKRINEAAEEQRAMRARALGGNSSWIGPRPGWLRRR